MLVPLMGTFTSCIPQQLQLAVAWMFSNPSIVSRVLILIFAQSCLDLPIHDDSSVGNPNLAMECLIIVFDKLMLSMFGWYVIMLEFLDVQF